MRSASALIALMLTMIGFSVTASALAQDTAAPESAVRGFYETYLHSLNLKEDPLVKRRTELRKFVTNRLLAAIDRAKKSRDGLNYDFFLDAQDWDETWEQSIATSIAILEGERAVVNLTLMGDSMGEHKLRVGLKREAGVWKIDSVNGREKP
jgi:hypothetical protein